VPLLYSISYRFYSGTLLVSGAALIQNQADRDIDHTKTALVILATDDWRLSSRTEECYILNTPGTHEQQCNPPGDTHHAMFPFDKA
jgi:hypothetical protein